jgi:hypothetical protein
MPAIKLISRSELKLAVPNNCDTNPTGTSNYSSIAGIVLKMINGKIYP